MIYRKTALGKSSENKTNLFQKYSHAYLDHERLPRGSASRGAFHKQQVYLKECSVLENCSEFSFKLKDKFQNTKNLHIKHKNAKREWWDCRSYLM